MLILLPLLSCLPPVSSNEMQVMFGEKSCEAKISVTTRGKLTENLKPHLTGVHA